MVGILFLFETNMAPFMPFRVILVIEWQHNTWTNMIVKMIILRLLASSDDKEKREDRCRCLSIGASDACRKNRRYDVWCRRESKPSQPIGTGWTDGPRKGIGALAYCVPETMSSAQEKFLQHRFNRRCIGVLRRCIDVSRREEDCEWPV